MGVGKLVLSLAHSPLSLLIRGCRPDSVFKENYWPLMWTYPPIWDCTTMERRQR